jgi:predicted homoserine dehydrogenase-like protein
MNTGAICQTSFMKGMRNAVICDVRKDVAVRAFEITGVKKSDILFSNKPSEINDAIKAGKFVVSEDSNILSDLELDCIVEGTGNPEVGSQVAFRAIQSGKNIIMLNVEADVVVGPILHRMARQAGVVYSVSSGDEPGLITELVDRWGGLGFEIVAVGKTPASLGKLDKYATPDTLAQDAKDLKVNPHFLVTFRDATKTAIEMTCISNATGLVPDKRGMHGPVAGVEDMAKLFRLKSEGGLLNRRGVIDYAIPLKNPDGSIDFVNSVTPGVFVVVRATHPQIQEDLKYFDVVHTDNYFTFYTPYHLVTNEIPLSVVWAVEDKEPTVVPEHGLLTEVIGKAKKDMKTGETLDGGGGYTVYAENDLAVTAKKENLVPFGLLDGAKLLKDVKKDQEISHDMVELKMDTMVYHLRKIQDRLIQPTVVD